MEKESTKFMGKLSHLDDHGRAKMVDVSDKDSTSRTAVARGTVHMRAETLALILADRIEKEPALGYRVIQIIDARES